LNDPEWEAGRDLLFLAPLVTRSHHCVATGNQSQGRQPVSTSQVYILPTHEQSSSAYYEEMNMASIGDQPSHARLGIAAPQPVQSQQSTTDDYLVPVEQLETDH